MKKINLFFIYYFIIVFLELISKYVFVNNIFNIGTIYMLVLSIPFALIFSIFNNLFNEKVNKVIFYLNLLLIIFFYGTMIVYYILLDVPFSITSLSMANQALDFITIIKDTLIKYWYYILLLIIPLILTIIINKKINFKRNDIITTFIFLLAFTITYCLPMVFLTLNDELKKLYFNSNDSIKIIDNFGLQTYFKIDIKRELIGYDSGELKNDVIEIPEEETFEKPEQSKPIVYEDNILDIDFLNLSSSNKNIDKLNNFMQNEKPTKKNKYTGMFKDKNLIFILAEGFNETAVDKDRTPTLYKLVNSGFVFKNFYSPAHFSTIGGEFQATTGLVPTQTILNNWKKIHPTIAFGLGNVFKKKEYKVQSFHDWTYDYYDRDKNMKTIGFDNYMACGSGLEKLMKCDWIPSDTDMINATTPKYLDGDDRFLTYYVTMSGHSPYNMYGPISRKHLDKVKGNYSESVRCYLAAQIELDLMLENLIRNLEESGKLDDTVISLVGDHYPYTLSAKEMNEMSTYTKDGVIEVNHSNLIIWNNEMKEPIIINKLGSQIDILPTLLNLFGIDYDSRLIVGKDILSTYPNVAIFANHSWVTDYGTYNANSKKFTLKKDKYLPNIEEYVKNTNNRVDNAYSISKLIIDNNYYEYVLK